MIIFIGQLDEKLVSSSPVLLISTLHLAENEYDKPTHLNWSRFRDDGFTILPNKESAPDFVQFLQSLHPGIICIVEAKVLT